MPKMICLETGSMDPSFNLAFEEYVLLNRKDGDYLILWQNDNALVVGMNQNTEEEFNRDFVEKHHIRVIRRQTGGGAVYHDLGNLNFSFITDVGQTTDLSIQRFTKSVISALGRLGVQAVRKGRNDILVDGRKISGTAQRILKTRILYHGTLLFDANLEMAQGALRTDSNKFRSKGVKSVRARIGNIREYLDQDMSVKQFRDFLWGELTNHDMVQESLSPKELEQIGVLKREKYDTWEWNFGKSPEYDKRNRRYWNGGILEVSFSVKRGMVVDICFNGDFLSVKPMDPIEEALKRCRFQPDAFRKILSRFSLKEYFGTITLDEVLCTVFDS